MELYSKRPDVSGIDNSPECGPRGGPHCSLSSSCCWATVFHRYGALGFLFALGFQSFHKVAWGEWNQGKLKCQSSLFLPSQPVSQINSSQVVTKLLNFQI